MHRDAAERNSSSREFRIPRKARYSSVIEEGYKALFRARRNLDSLIAKKKKATRRKEQYSTEITIRYLLSSAAIGELRSRKWSFEDHLKKARDRITIGKKKKKDFVMSLAHRAWFIYCTYIHGCVRASSSRKNKKQILRVAISVCTRCASVWTTYLCVGI